MNKYGRLPWPYNKFAELTKQKIISRLNNFEKVNFNYDFYCAFGNLIGKDVWFTNTYILDYAPVYFGEHITIGPDVKIITSWHELDNLNIVKAKPIIIEDNVWITMNAIILPGVVIGKNSIVGAGAVVTKSVPANSLIAGNPAKVVKYLSRDYPFWLDTEKEIRERDIVNNNLYLQSIARLLPKTIKKPLQKVYFFFK